MIVNFSGAKSTLCVPCPHSCYLSVFFSDLFVLVAFFWESLILKIIVISISLIKGTCDCWLFRSKEPSVVFLASPPVVTFSQYAVGQVYEVKFVTLLLAVWKLKTNDRGQFSNKMTIFLYHIYIYWYIPTFQYGKGFFFSMEQPSCQEKKFRLHVVKICIKQGM